MIDKKNNFLLIIVFTLLVLSLISAFFIEYGLGHKPCKLCLYQRYPYYISILLLMSIFVLKESTVCAANNLDQILSKEDLLKQLKQNTISCKDVTFRFLGLSLASINTIFSLILSYIFFTMFKNYENNK